MALAQRYAQKDPILARVLDPAMMTEIRSKIVENKEDKAEKKKVRNSADQKLAVLTAGFKGEGGGGEGSPRTQEAQEGNTFVIHTLYGCANSGF